MNKTEKQKAEYDKWHKNKTDLGDSFVWHEFVKENIRKWVSNPGSKKVLEIGCGRGGLAFWFSRNIGSKEYVAADFSQEALEIAKSKMAQYGVSNVIWSQQDIQNIDYDSEYFDIVISCETIEHVPDPRQAIREMYRVLKPGGLLMLTTPNYLNFWRLYRIYLRLTGRKWTEGGQPWNNFMLMPRTVSWIRKERFSIKKVDSEIFSIPVKSSKILHLRISKFKLLFRWFGLQSFYIAQKK